MRAYITLSAKNCIVPFDHRDQLLKILYQWMDTNEDDLPRFSFSRFEGSRNSLKGLSFSQDTSFFFSSPNNDLVLKLQHGAKVSPTLFNGLKVTEVKTLDDPNLMNRELFYLASPLLLLNAEMPDNFVVYNDEHANPTLKTHTIKQLQAAGIHDDSFDIVFDANYASAGTKKISYNGNNLRASWCHVLIHGSQETKNYLWHIGLGHLTELGFGAIM